MIKWIETKMTSDTTPAPFVASASGQWGSGTAPFYAFDGGAVKANGFWSSEKVVSWIQIDLGKPTIISSVILMASPSYITATPKDFDILGSNDGINFDTLSSVKNEVSWEGDEAREFSFNNKNDYRYYRVSVLTNNGYSSFSTIKQLRLGEWFPQRAMIIKNTTTNQYYSLAEKTLILLPNASSKNMILHGIEAGTEVQLDEPFDKINYPVEDSTSVGEGKVFKKTIDNNSNIIINISAQ